MLREDAIQLLSHAERNYHLKVIENICEETVRELPLLDRLRVVGRAVMERTDCAGYVMGQRLVRAADQMDDAC